jgi:hypothetical protein
VVSMPKSSELPPGKGIHLESVAGDQFCDGTLQSWCGKGVDADCLLTGHNDNHNHLKLDGYSGWIKMVIPNIKYGYILLRLETWAPSDSNPATDVFPSINNDTSHQQLRRQQRRRRLQQLFVPEFNGTILRSSTNVMAPVYDDNNDIDYTIDHDWMDSPPNSTTFSSSASPRLGRQRRHLKYTPPSVCDEF